MSMDVIVSLSFGLAYVGLLGLLWLVGRKISYEIRLSAQNARMIRGFAEAMELVKYGAQDEARELLSELANELERQD